MMRSPLRDVLTGAERIAEYLGIETHQVDRLAERGSLPHFRDGHSLCARKSTLSAWLAEREAKSKLRAPNSLTNERISA